MRGNLQAATKTGPSSDSLWFSLPSKKHRTDIELHARNKYNNNAVVDRYMMSIEEIINLPILLDHLRGISQGGRFSQVIDEIVLQSSVEFNYENVDSVEDDSDL